MKRFFASFADAIFNWSGVALAILVIALAISTDHFREKATQAAQGLADLKASVKAQNDQAQLTIKQLTDQRDAKQLALDTAYETREKNDAANQLEIARLNDELEQRPIRVRVVTKPAVCGLGGSGSTSEPTTPADFGAADLAQTHGLLPAENAQRLRAVISEMEVINAAYASCRGHALEQWIGATR